MKRPEQEKIDKLPAWAKGYIRDMERREEIAIDALDELRLQAKPSKVHIRDKGPSNKPEFANLFKWHPIAADVVMFRLAGHEIEVSVSRKQDGHYPGESVIVRCNSGSLRVAPLVSNSIEVYVEK